MSSVQGTGSAEKESFIGDNSLYREYFEIFQREKSVLSAVPNCEIRYDSLGYKVEVPVNNYAIQTVASAFLDAFRAPFRRDSKRDFHVLKGMCGRLEPGRMTLVIAPPGHGKSSFLRALTGRIPYAKLEGDIRYNGVHPSDTPFNIRHLTAYVDEADQHMPHLTVKETFEFAVRNLSADPSLAGGDTNEVESKRVAEMIKNLDLEECQDTIVGNRMVRGVSGGQRKRVTIGEMLLGGARLLALDEFSTGLDAATTIKLTTLLRAWCRANGGCVITALLQPPPEVFGLFDDIILLRHGQCIFHGPKDEIEPYFQSLGVPIPDDQDLADFLTEFLTDPRFAVFHVLRRRALHEQLAISSGANGNATAGEYDVSESTIPRRRHSSCNEEVDENTIREEVSRLELSTDFLVSKFQESSMRARELHDVNASIHASNSVSSTFAEKQYITAYSRSLWSLLKANLWRQKIMMLKEKQLFIPRINQSIVMGLIVGSLFWQLGLNDFTLKIGLTLYILIQLSFSNFAEVPLAAAYKMVVFKQLDAGFYPSFVYVLSVILLTFPLGLLESSILGTTVYFMADLSNDAGRFFVYLAVLVSQNLAFGALYRMFAYAAPDPDLAQVMVGPYTALSLLFGGFLQTKDKLQDFIVWAYWISPFSWSTRSVVVNEFRSSRYDFPAKQDPSVSQGVFYLESYEFQTNENWVWIGIIVLLCYFVVAATAGSLLLTYLRYRTNQGTSRSEDDDGDEASVRVTDRKESAASTMPFEPVTVTFKDVMYTVPVGKRKKRTLLKGIHGYARPGDMTALMGSSGAGKTTLLDVLAGRKTKGEIAGDIIVNGHAKDESSFARVTGYVEQEDIHLATATVRESLQFAAKLRLPDTVTRETRERFVDEVLELLELTDLQHRLIGDNIIAGLSPGQLKRVTIGVELVCNPAVLFLDEPTSGLDSRAAATVIRVVRRIANTGRTVICTIHQPSADLFYMFDNMLLLASGGYEVYNGPLGPEALDLVHFMESIPGAFPCPKKMNPATWMLDVIGRISAEKSSIEQSDENENTNGSGSSETRESPKVLPLAHTFYRESNTFKATLEEIDRLNAATQQHKQLQFSSKHSASYFRQFAEVLKRTLTSTWRNPAFSLLRLVIIAMLGFVFGFIYFDLDTNDQPGMNSALAVLMTTSAFVGVVNNLTALPVIVKNRALFYREQASNTYAPGIYGISAALTEIPWIALNVLLFSIPFYFMVGLRDDAVTFFRFYLVYLLMSIIFNFMGQFLGALMPSAEIAMILQGGLISTFFLFGGVFVPGPAIPEGWKWYYHFDPVSHALHALSTSQFEDDTAIGFEYINRSGNVVVGSKREYVAEYTGFEYDQYGEQVGYLFIYIFVLEILKNLALRYIRHLSR